MGKGRLFGLTVAFALLAPASADAHHGHKSLPHGAGPLPGPDLLYEIPRRAAPQLRNRGPWRAPSLLVSGASAYIHGEFVYQDFIYDDHGAQGDRRDPSDPRSGDDIFSAPNGTITYPTDVESYHNNIADLVELRVKPKRKRTLFRLTFNSMTKPRLVATTIALGDGPEAELPFGAGASTPADKFLFIRGRPVKLIDAAGQGKTVKLAPAKVSKRRRQIQVSVPRRVWDPGRDKVRMAAATGLWDKAAKSYLVPEDSATPTRPGGAVGLSDPSALFNVAFRFDEALPNLQDPGVLVDTAWWREKDQGDALARNDISPFFAEVNFRKLRRRKLDYMHDEPGGMPTTGPINRILSSRFANGQGVDYTVEGCGKPAGCIGQYPGRLQPYSIYVPDKPVPRGGFGLTLLMHSLGGSFNQYHGTRNQSQFGDRGDGHIVITTESRGPNGWYYGLAGAEVFEVWAEVARRYRLDPRKSAATGYSMGGYGTYKFATQFPDLFAAGQPTVGAPGLGFWIPGTPFQPAAGSNTNPMLPSLRHVPFMIWNGVEDELVPYAGALKQGQTFAELGLEHIFDSFLTAEHFTLALNDQFAPAADFLGDRKTVKNPAHVTYVRNPSMDFPELGTKADHAYWLDRVKTASDGLGTVDAVSGGFGRGDAPAGPTQNSAGALTGGFLPALSYVRKRVELGDEPSQPKSDELTIELENIKSLRVNVKRAKLSCRAAVEVQSATPAKVRLAGCGRTVSSG
jgi:predicted esterase